MKIIDTNLKEINLLQEKIMEHISEWARNEKTPIPRKRVISYMKSQGVKDFTTINALNSLKRKGYIRHSVSMSNTTSYVQLRGL